jgi:hypothetical protein
MVEPVSRSDPALIGPPLPSLWRGPFPSPKEGTVHAPSGRRAGRTRVRGRQRHPARWESSQAAPSLAARRAAGSRPSVATPWSFLARRRQIRSVISMSPIASCTMAKAHTAKSAPGPIGEFHKSLDYCLIEKNPSQSHRLAGGRGPPRRSLPAAFRVHSAKHGGAPTSYRRSFKANTGRPSSAIPRSTSVFEARVDPTFWDVASHPSIRNRPAGRDHRPASLRQAVP